jgi:hypothetical protein
MSTAKVATQPDLSLNKLQLIVQQQEGIFGPLTHISTGEGKNVLEFEVRAKPKVRAVLKVSDQDPPVPKKGHVLVCHGDCFISGKKKHVAVFREGKS